MSDFKNNLAAFAQATDNQLYDVEWNDGDWMIEAVETQESIDDFVAASRNYAEATNPVHGIIAGFPFVAFRKIQVRRGDQRRELSVIDFGDRRVAIDANLDHYV